MEKTDLSQGIDDTPSEGKRVHIVDKFYCTIRWISQPDRERMLKKCSDRMPGGETQVNMTKHAIAFTKEIILGWEGLTTETIIDGLGVPLQEQAIATYLEVEAENGGQLPFGQRFAADLYRRSEVLVLRISEELKNWDHGALLEKVRAAKKGSGSPGTSGQGPAPSATA